MRSFRSYYFKNNTGKGPKGKVPKGKSGKSPKRERRKKKGLEKALFFLKAKPPTRFALGSAKLSTKLSTKLKVKAKRKRPSTLMKDIKSKNSFRLAVIYLFCGLLIIPLFSLIRTVDQVNEKFSNVTPREEGLPEIVLVDQNGENPKPNPEPSFDREEKVVSNFNNQNASNDERRAKFSQDKLENLENPNEFIDKDKIGDLLDDEDENLAKVSSNPLSPPSKTSEAKSLVAEARKRKSYTIKSGDNLWSIAKRNRVSLDSLISLNEIELPHQLRQGSSIEIPTLSGIYYQVKKGDTLHKLAKKYGVADDEIKKYNQLGSFLKVGEEIFLPGAKLTPFEKKLIFGRLFIKPIEGKLSSNYGMRFHPIKKKWLFHTGIDIVSSKSKKVRSLNDGVVAFVGKKGNYGNYVKIKHKNGYESAYAHLEKFFVKKGQRVKQGQTIAEIGNTGLSTGTHLHLEIKHNGKFINPKRFITYK